MHMFGSGNTIKNSFAINCKLPSSTKVYFYNWDIPHIKLIWFICNYIWGWIINYQRYLSGIIVSENVLGIYNLSDIFFLMLLLVFCGTLSSSFSYLDILILNYCSLSYLPFSRNPYPILFYLISTLMFFSIAWEKFLDRWKNLL